MIAVEQKPNMRDALEEMQELLRTIALVGSLGFLGFSADPGAANWGQMIQENRLALATQPWAVLAPVLVIAIFCVGTNLMADGIAQAAQRGDN